MLCLRTKIFFLLISLPLFLSNRVVSAQQSSLTSQQVERLTKMAELWGTVKYFHPYLAYREINWDSAMVAVLPDVLEAEDTESYVSVIESLLSVLDDPSTYVIQSATKPSARTEILEPVVTWTSDSILVATLNENTLDLLDYVMVFQQLSEVQSNLSNVRGVVFDMRSERGLPKGPEPLEVLIQYSGLENALATAPLVVPGQRSRVHNGFAQEAPVDTDYSSSFYVTNSRLIEPNSTGNTSPVVFLVNQLGQLPSIAIALQDAGIAAIISEGYFSGGGLIATHPIEIGENHTVHVRSSELVRTDGTTGFDADLVTKSDSGGSLDQALKLVRNFGLSEATSQKIPPSSVNQWNTLSKDLYPSRPERVLAAFKVWYVIKQFFPYHNLLDRDWDAVFRESLPAIVDAPDAKSYHFAIAKMYARIQDTHGFMRSPVLQEYLIDALPPLHLQWVEEQPVVIGLTDLEAAREAGIEIGDVILEIDGRPTSERIREVVGYFAASTPQALMRLTMRALLSGPDSSMVSLKLKGNMNQVKHASVPRRRAYNQIRDLRTGDVLKLLPGDIGYVDLDRLVVPEVDELFDRFKDTKAIIFDMRGYPNGTAWSIAPYLAKESETEAGYYTRFHLYGPDERSRQRYSFIDKIPPSTPGKHYDGLTVMLIDEHSQSQSEYTGMFFEAANGTVFVGSHTSGAIGNTTGFYVPGNINLSFSGQEITYPDGRQVQRLGLVPTVEVRPTVEGLRDGRDEVLEAALSYIERKLRLN